jgi:hypothetical protein
VGIHRTAEVHQQENADVRLLRRSHDDLELSAVARCSVDRLVEVELKLGTFARERAQFAQCHLDLAHVEDDVGAIGPVGPRVRDPHGAPASAERPDAQSRGVRAVGTERARAAGAYPSVAAVVPLLLLAQSLLEQAQELIQAKVLEHRELLGGEVLSSLWITQPFVELFHQVERLGLDAAKAREEGLVEGVEVGFIMHAEGARDVVETVERAVVQAHSEGTRERHGLLKANLDLALPELEKKRYEHRPTGRA